MVTGVKIAISKVLDRLTLRVVFQIALGVIFVAVGIAVVLLVRQHMRAQALTEAELKARIILDHNLATHTYFSHQLKPYLFEWTAPLQDEEYFAPVWMSSTYAVREVEKYFQSLSSADYYYKEAAINARMPANEADAYERQFLEELNEEPELTDRSLVRTLDGQPYFVTLRRGETMEASCLRCHSVPEAAPEGLVDAYGAERSFNRELGEVASAISIRIPLSEAYATADRFAWRLSLVLLGLLIALFVAQSWLSQRFFFAPVDKIRERAFQIAVNETQLGAQIPVPWGRELRALALAFNKMSRALRRSYDHLEDRIAARTVDLRASNEQLEREIGARQRAEWTLRQTTERLRIQHKIDTAILAARSAEEIARAALTRLRDTIPYLYASISEIDGPRQRGRDIIVLSGGEGGEVPGTPWHPLSAAGGFIELQRQGHVHLVRDIAALASPSTLEQRLKATGVRAYISVPMLIHGELTGTLNMASETPDFFRPTHVEILREIAASLAVALQQARLLDQAQQDAETKRLLLREVNHRVKNNLDAIIGLLYVEQRHALPEARAAFQPIVDNLTQRIMGLARVHSMLSATAWQPLLLSELTEQLIYTAVQNSAHDARILVDVQPSPVRVSPAHAHHLALVISELTINTLKYAVVGREVVRIAARVTVRENPDHPVEMTGSHDFDSASGMITLTYRDDGPGYPGEILGAARYSAGLDIVQKVVRKNLMGELVLHNEGGAVAEIRFKA
jgi:hypothetical protein